MYQESDDKIKGSPLKDTILIILLIAAFFAIGAVAAKLRSGFENDLPIYIFGILCAACVYLVYRLRVVGWRYTVFHEPPQTEYDARFDDYIRHEDYPYPVGTFVVERTVSAKGEILAAIDKADMVCLLAPGESYGDIVDDEYKYCSHSKSKAHSLIYNDGNRVARLYFSPSPELIAYINKLIRSKTEDAQ